MSVPAESRDWLIWSNEHRLWWRENGQGYTGTIGEAGRYTKGVADMICLDGGRQRSWSNAPGPYEVAVLSPEAAQRMAAQLCANAPTELPPEPIDTFIAKHDALTVLADTRLCETGDSQERAEATARIRMAPPRLAKIVLALAESLPLSAEASA